MDSIYKTRIEVVVLSREPLTVSPDRGGHWEPSVDGSMAEDLDDIVYQMNEGDYIGDWNVVGESIVGPKEVALELALIGNDGTFFDNGDDDKED